MFYSRSLAFFGNEIFIQRESGTDPDNTLFFSNLQKMRFLFAKSTLLLTSLFTLDIKKHKYNNSQHLKQREI